MHIVVTYVIHIRQVTIVASGGYIRNKRVRKVITHIPLVIISDPLVIIHNTISISSILIIS